MSRAFAPAALAAATLAAIGAVGPALAQDDAVDLPAFALPQGCALVVIAQMSDCSASVVYTCEGDADGRRYIASMLPEGMSFLSSVDADYTWLDSLNAWDGVYHETVQPVRDPIDIDSLVATGIDSFLIEQVNRATGETVTYRGYDWLSEYETEIDGVRLLETTFHLRETDAEGEVTWEAQGSEYVDPERRLFFQGRTWYDGDRDTMWVAAPVEFVFPGEPGADVFTPLHGCDR